MPVEIRTAEDLHVPEMVAIACEADDSRVFSVESLRHLRRARPLRFHAQPGTAWASIAVDGERRGEGIGSMLGEALVDHMHTLEATTVTAFVRQSDEGERWARKRGWSRALNSSAMW